MTPDQIVAARKERWERLELLVGKAQRSPRSLDSSAALELVLLYREASADLARLRSIGVEPMQIIALNRSVTRAHGQLYGRRRRGRRWSIVGFYSSEYPRLVRKHLWAMLTSLAIFVVCSLMGYFTVQTNPSVVADLLGGGEAETTLRGDKTGEEFLERFQREPGNVLASAVTTNNIVVAFTACVSGITFGLGTVFLLMINGAMVGGFAAAWMMDGAGRAFWETVLVHGALELLGIVIAAGAGLALGYAMWCPGRRTRGRALTEQTRETVKIALGLVPAFIIAGIYEGFLTPNTQIPAGVKLVIGVSTMLLYVVYLVIGSVAQCERDITSGSARQGVARSSFDSEAGGKSGAIR